MKGAQNSTQGRPVKTEAITEGSTVLLVPAAEGLPRQADPAFFNPRARASRDISVMAYAAHASGVKKEPVLLDAMAGIGARGLRAACELRKAPGVVLNDLNPTALALAKKSAEKNGASRVEFSSMEANAFLASRSAEGLRGTIVDIDPFGSPAKFLDSGLRASVHGGMLCATATDLQVLCGIFPEACIRRYGGAPIRRSGFSNEIALRLVFGCIAQVCGRLDMAMEPLFAHSDQHYYRAFARVVKRPRTVDMGYASACTACQSSQVTRDAPTQCSLCGGQVLVGGPLWAGRLFDAGFASEMAGAASDLPVSAPCIRYAQKAVLEAGMPGAYYRIDDLASLAKKEPPRLERAVELLQAAGYMASPTSLDPTGVRTDAPVGEIQKAIF